MRIIYFPSANSIHTILATDADASKPEEDWGSSARGKNTKLFIGWSAAASLALGNCSCIDSRAPVDDETLRKRREISIYLPFADIRFLPR